MNIGLLTTWNSKCGIADYSEYLVNSFIRAGHEVTIFCNHGSYDTSGDATYVYPRKTVIPGVFGVFWWRENTFFDKEKIKKYIELFKVDVLHIQYQSSLYEETLNDLIKEIDIPVYVTLHDSSIHPKHFPISVRVKIASFIAHKEGIGKNLWRIPYPYPMQIPKILSFGMGRNQSDIINQVCDELGFMYTDHDARELDSWLQQEDLIKLIREHDAVVLWYNDAPGLVGNSFAARVGLSCYRPVFVNDTQWFSDLDNGLFIKVTNTKEALKSSLEDWFNYWYKDLMTFNKMADILVERYKCDLLPKV